MTKIGLLFPNQLFETLVFPKNLDLIYLIEIDLFFNQYNFHKQKLVFQRASMKAYLDHLKKNDLKVDYINAHDERASIITLFKKLKTNPNSEIHYIDPVDNWLSKQLEKVLKVNSFNAITYENPLFINSSDELSIFFKKEKKKFYQTSFYKEQRIKRNILIDHNNNPVGGKWTFDTENRKKYPAKKVAPTISFPFSNDYIREAIDYVNTHFNNNLGCINELESFPVSHKDAKLFLNQFFEERFDEFGIYEDAIVKNENYLHHSLLSPLINVGLLKPLEVINNALDFSKKHNVPINSLEGFVRQILGWREFIRGMYTAKGTEQRTRNYWELKHQMPDDFYTGTTGIEPVDDTIKKLIKSGYNHHIERLMILGNFMLLCEINPDAVYQWFMEFYIDAYDWVMVPNVYGMSQFADGGFLATKPYISSSNYILKMSDYKKGDWCQIWDSLFWRFMNKNRDFFLKNPRLSMLIRTYDKFDMEKKIKFEEISGHYLEKIHH